MPRNLLSPSIFWTFSTPASALYEPCRQSSKPWNAIVYPLTPPAAFFWLTANCTHGQVGPDLDGALGSRGPGRTAAREGDKRRHGEDYESPSSNHMVPPCANGGIEFALDASVTRRPLPSDAGARVRRRRMRPHGGGRTDTPWQLSTRRALQVKLCLAATVWSSADVGAPLYQYGSAAL